MTALQLGKSTLPTVALGDDTVLGDAQFLTMLIVSTGVSAAMGGHTEACRWLVEKGASVAHESKQVRTAIRCSTLLHTFLLCSPNAAVNHLFATGRPNHTAGGDERQPRNRGLLPRPRGRP